MFFSLIGCDKTEGDDGNLKGININVYVDLLVENEDGIDLLDPNVENSLNTNSIKLFYVNGNEKIEVYNPSLDFERNFKILEENSYYFLRLFVNDSIVNGYTETLLDWGNGELDSIKSIVSKTNTSIVCDSVWYNNKLEYPTNNEYSPRRMFRVVK
jgi:hypothetical protein